MPVSRCKRASLYVYLIRCLFLVIFLDYVRSVLPQRNISIIVISNHSMLDVDRFVDFETSFQARKDTISLSAAALFVDLPADSSTRLGTRRGEIDPRPSPPRK